jgi:hypothetical protein
MESYEISKTSSGFHVEGFPETVKLLKIEGPNAVRLSQLALHKHDLDFALECLTTINKVPNEPIVLREALWRAAVVHLLKCFGFSRSRFSLDPRIIYKDESLEQEVFDYFKSLRDKHFMHDENAYLQSLPGAALNKRDSSVKIAKIVCFNVAGVTLDQEHYSNLRLLITRAREWVVAQFDSLCDILTSELEARSYDELYACPEIQYSLPRPEEVHKARP